MRYFKNPINGKQRNLSHSEIARNFMICIFIFLMQMTMAFTIFSEVSEELSSTKEVSTGEFFKIVVVRLMCAIALHMMIEGEVYQAI